MTIPIVAFAIAFAAFIWAQISASKARRDLRELQSRAWVRNAKGRLEQFSNN